MPTPQEVEAMKQEDAVIVKKGIEWYDKLKDEIEKKYPAGSVTIIDIDTGSYIVGETTLVAMKMAETKFSENVRAYIRHVVGPHPFVEFGGCP